MNNKLITKKVVDLLVYRIQQEEDSSRLYEQMSLFLNNKGYINTAKLYKQLANEEKNHAQWAKDYLLSFDVVPQLEDLEKQDITYNTLKDVLDQSLAHETKIALQCNELAQEALKMNDFMLFSLAQKYNYEQIEEVGRQQDLVDSYALTQNDLFFDQYITKYLD